MIIFLKDYKDSEKMIIVGIKSIMRRKYIGGRIYLDNFSRFHGVFILRLLAKLGSKSPIINDGRIIEVPLSFEWNKK